MIPLVRVVNMRFLSVLLFALSFLSLLPKSSTKCSSGNYKSDPEPWGGASCTLNTDCGGVGVGVCVNATGSGLVCVCPDSRGRPDCSYKRYEAALVGGLNIGLPFIDVAGVGNIIMENDGPGIAQLLMMILPVFSCCFVACFGLCAEACALGATRGRDYNSVVQGGGSDNTEGRLMASGGFMCLIYVALAATVIAGFVWSIVDGVDMLNCDIDDGNGYALYN